MNRQKAKTLQRRKRKKRVRKKVVGTAEQPRLSVFRSLRHIYAQIIDDDSGVTLVTASTQSKDLADKLKRSDNVEAAGKVGEAVARKALAVGIHRVRFDRSGYLYHGRVQALAEAVRKAGLVF